MITLLTKYERGRGLGLSKAGPLIDWENAWSKIASVASLVSTLPPKELRGDYGRLVVASKFAGETIVGHQGSADAPSLLLC